MSRFAVFCVLGIAAGVIVFVLAAAGVEVGKGSPWAIGATIGLAAGVGVLGVIDEAKLPSKRRKETVQDAAALIALVLAGLATGVDEVGIKYAAAFVGTAAVVLVLGALGHSNVAGT